MLEDVIEELTKLKIKQAIKDKEKGTTTMIQISKTTLVGICIDLCKIIERYEVEYENRNKV